ncbi:endonuclease [Crenobacter oryzisoli]|nr:endonuclease [Crenobacter sp. SG2303]
MKQTMFRWLALGALLALVSACSEKDAQQLANKALQHGGKALAEHAEKLIREATGQLTGELSGSSSGSVPDNVPLVNGTKAVGHRDFAGAKRVLPRLYSGMEVTFYCGCDYHDKTIDQRSCGFKPRKNAARAARLEWEHIVPAWVLGHQRQCWKNGGRKNCADNDRVFARAEGDLVNLVPAIGEVNADRSNYSFSAWQRGNPHPQYGQCPMIIDSKMKKVQPPEPIRGRIARIYLYMHQTYALRMSRQDSQLMCAWSREHPVDDWELRRNKRIRALQGSDNPFVTDPQQVERFCQAALA